MRDYKTRIGLDTMEKIIDVACKTDCEIDEYQGCLLDNYIISYAYRIKVGNVTPRKYMIVRECYLNEWSSCLELILTDNEELVEMYRETWEREMEELETAYQN